MLRLWPRRARSSETPRSEPAEGRDEHLLDPHFLRRLERLELVARHTQQGTARGQRTGRGVGVGIEFAEHRPYSSGDDLRFVDFAAYARSDRLLVKQFAETRDVEVHVLLDCSLSMGLGAQRKLRYAKQLAAAVGYVSLANLDRLTVQTFSDELGARLPPMRGKSRALSLLRFLDVQQPAGQTHFVHCAQRFVAREARRGLAVVISDGYDRVGLVPGIDALRFARFQPVVLLVRDQRELTALASGDYLLVDSETGESHEAVVDARSITRQTRRADAHYFSLRRELREKQVPTFELDAARPFDSTLLDVLRRGGLFR